MNNPYVVGHRVYLRHPTHSDAEGPWHEWFSDDETTRWLNRRHLPNSVDQQRSVVDGLSLASDRVVLLIIDIASDEPVGVCSLGEINWVQRNCHIALIIGNKAFRQGPHLLESMSLLLAVAFDRLNMRAVLSSFAESNSASSALHELFRFTQVGCIPGFFWDRGQYVDTILALLTAVDWRLHNA